VRLFSVEGELKIFKEMVQFKSVGRTGFERICFEKQSQTVADINHCRIQAVFVWSHTHTPAVNFWITPVPHLMKSNGLNKGLRIVCFWNNPTVEEKHITLVLTSIFYVALFHCIKSFFFFFFNKDVWKEKFG